MAPTTDRVIKVLGSWSEAIEAAGFTPRAPQAGSITRMVESYAHAADERRLNEIAGPRSPIRPILAAEDLRCGVSSGARVLLAHVAPSSYPSFVLGREVA